MSTASLRARMAQIDASIAEHKLSLKSLERERSAVEAQLYSTTFPVLTLPVEITTAIFSFCLPTIEEIRENNRRHRDRFKPFPAPDIDLYSLVHENRRPKEQSRPSPTPTAPNTLVGCCRLWKDIALATPSLWTTLPLSLTDIDFNDLERERPNEYVNRWLGRAGLQPLTFVLCVREERSSHHIPSPSILCMQDIVRRYAHRLQELDLEFTGYCYDLEVMQLGSIYFPVLHRATLGYYDVDDLSQMVQVFTKAPGLCELDLHPETWLDTLTPPWAQLTKFGGPVPNITLFAMAPNLLEAICTVDEFYPSSAIVHTRLQSLALLGASTNSGDIARLLAQLTSPALRSLRISTHTHLPTLSEFLNRSASPLRTLSISVNADAFEDWEPILGRLDATLEELEIRFPFEDFLSNIFRLRGRLPHLHTLSILDSPIPNNEPLISFLHRRSTSDELVRLQSFRLSYHPDALSDYEGEEDLTTGEYDTGGRRWRFDTKNRMLATQGVDIRIGRGKASLISF
ncbi:hypothetical protein C8R46DRAFT_1093327 [Mycena filopes]|nr:hypothetical protein C8R46DRAFT_1093327 [Mycena filopes]